MTDTISALDGDVPVYLESSALALWNDALDSFEGIIGDEMEPAQPEQTPLTREQIDEFFPIGMGPYHTIVGEHNILKFVRKIEAAHGIKPAKEQA